MAEDTATTDEPTSPITHESINGDVDHENNTETNGAAQSSTIRSRGSKVSNLRAAFEQSGSNGGPVTRSKDTGKRNASHSRSADIEAELSRLKDALSKEQEEKDATKQRLDALQAEIGELREQLKTEHAEADVAMTEPAQEDMDMAEPNGHIDTEELAIELHNARAQAQASEDELGMLRTQLNDMKRSIATNTRIESHEMTDSAFQGEFGTLCYSLRDWVINTYRKAKIDRTSEDMCAVVDGLDDESRDILRPIFERWNAGYKLILIQAAVVSLMMPIFQDPMPFGLPETLTWSDAVRSTSEELFRVLDSAAYNRWRATTFDIICHSEVISPFVHSASNRITDTICTTLDAVCGTSTVEAQADALRNMVRRVIALSHSLRVQRAVYHVELPAPGALFDSSTMEEVNEDHEDADEQREIQCSIFPTVLKTSMTATRAIIFKARVS